ncbi:MAG: hypothetical protein A3E85_04985 [Gammaproteobacteria bacterium RIFCSPHIGHO2_12_FULL_45_12]|nr:MAG: hypothetical protein A3E85_04985 [Gammaproteobacteria bacterium RIFCSPHIGHO2_12_FULL_45_12]
MQLSMIKIGLFSLLLSLPLISMAKPFLGHPDPVIKKPHAAQHSKRHNPYHPKGREDRRHSRPYQAAPKASRYTTQPYDYDMRSADDNPNLYRDLQIN